MGRHRHQAVAPLSGRRKGRVRVGILLLSVMLMMVPLMTGSAVRAQAPVSAPHPFEQPPTHALWLSGAFIGRGASDTSIQEMGEWRGRPLEVLTVYPDYQTWAGITSSTWVFSQVEGYRGKLVYSLPLLPVHHDGATLAQVAAGKYDHVFVTIADQMRAAGRGDTIVRVGWEANGSWLPWGVDAAHASDFRAATRRVMTLMKARTPTLTMSFEIACNTILAGASDRLSALEQLYPGDDLTDVVGCDHYDNFDARATTRESWPSVLNGVDSPGLQDVADFARAHGKRFAVPEWGLDGTENGGGDNPLFIQLMYEFFVANDDVLLFEAYFDEPMTYIKSSLWGDGGPSLNPRSAQEYVRLWSARWYPLSGTPTPPP
jgi:Glycosyl hydrolase family 26